MIQYCNESASSLSTMEMAVYLINCLYLVHSNVALYEFTELALEKLEGQIQAHLDTLVTEQAAYLLGKVGLFESYTSLQNGELTDEVLAPVKEQSKKLITQFFSAPDSSLLPQLSLLTSGKFKADAHHRAIELFVNAYRQVYDALKEKLGEDKLTNVLPHSPEQVNDLIT